MRDDEETRKLVEKAQLEEAAVGVTGNPKNKFPDLNVLRKFTERYDNYTISNANDIEPTGPWKLLYRARGKMDGFHEELNFNTENGCLLLVIKGPSTPGKWFSDIKNMVVGSNGGEIDSASAFTLIKKVRELILKFKVRPMLFITGHPLGGFLAPMITYTLTFFFPFLKSVL
jgi:hypothetical protein